MGDPGRRIQRCIRTAARSLFLVWKSTRIARISPKTGWVTGWIELAGLSDLVKVNERAGLNGIVYDAQSDRLFITGKFWPSLFEIRLAPSH